ncbi:MAG: hypothetical protein GXO75_09900 [Calditrichaeota bacterium]|nr:hypothetical protein [Calditrichota bacterium]
MLRIADVLKFYVLLILVLGMAVSVLAQEMNPSLKDSAKEPVKYIGPIQPYKYL